jgi:hypothetical protein
MKTLGIALVLLLVGGCVHADIKSSSPGSAGWQAVYKHDENGNPLAGTMDALIDGIRRGYSVRVGWGWEHEIEGTMVRLEHMAQPLFLTVIQEQHVSIVIDAHPLLQSYFDIKKQSMQVSGHIWQCVLTTQGTFNAKVYNRATGELVRDWPQRQIMTWFLEFPATSSESPVRPLYDASGL